MTTRILCGAITGFVGLYNLYRYAICDSNDTTLYSWLIAGTASLCCSAYIFCSEDD